MIKRFTLARLNVGARLSYGFGVVLLLLCAISAVGLWRLQVLSEKSVQIIDERVPQLALLQNTLSEINGLALAARDALLSSDAGETDKQLQTIEAGRTTIGKHIETLVAALNTQSSDKALAEAFSQHSSGVLVALVKFSRTVKGGDKAAGAAVLSTFLQPKLQSLAEAVRGLQEAEMKRFASAKADTLALRDASLAQTAALVALALLLGGAAAWSITRSITVPLKEAVDVADRTAAGELGLHIDASRSDELGRLLLALQRMQESLAGTVQQVREGCETVASASAQIASGNADLSQRTERQASSLQETAASMEQLGSTVRQNADNAHQADRLAQDASAVAQRGGAVVGQVVQTMEGINGSARRIADIVGVIDSIAFQTNILALNAAVEAARAGESGRGFAVVASEVRALAQRSAGAAKEIRSLIADSVERVASGSQLVGQAGATMQEIVASISRVSAIVAEISSASLQQTEGIGQIGQAVALMDTTTQQNAALVEQSSAAAESLNRQAQALVEAVAVFRVSGVARPSAEVV